MAIVRCNKCASLQEQPDNLAGQTIPCPRCANPSVVYPTLLYVEKLLDKYFAAQKELSSLRESSGKQGTAPAAATAPASPLDIDLGNTDHLASEVQHGPIYDWFRKRQIKVQANMRNVDTSGFFDEVAEIVGANMPVLGEVVERIRWSQHKEHASTLIHLDKKSREAAKAITDFCQKLYDFSFVAKCFRNKAENNIRLVLQTAPGVRDFFNGEWLEWHALMASLRYAKERGRRFSCGRRLHIELQNGDTHELDVFMLIDGQTPICIECKSGEFRQDIDHYLALKKRLGIPGKHFVMCVAGMTDDNAKAFTAMYDLAFTNERSLADHLSRLF